MLRFSLVPPGAALLIRLMPAVGGMPLLVPKICAAARNATCCGLMSMTTMLIFRPHEREPRIIDIEARPWMADVEFALRGPVERVPGFFSIQHAGAVHRCVAFALRDRADRSTNVAATIARDAALRRDMGVGLIRHDSTRADQLAGPVAVVLGN